MTSASSHSNNSLPGAHPHIESQLLDLVTGMWQPTLLEQEALIDHLAACTYCKIVLAAFVVNMADDAEEDTNEILRLLAETIDETERRALDN
jgi:hypothetical protein